MVSFNCSSWGSGLSAALERGTQVASAASVVCLQELRTTWRGRAGAFWAARTAGWDLTLGECVKGPGGRPSAGVGICCKRHLRTGAGVDPTVHNVVIVPGRAICTPVRVRGLTRPLLIITIYLIPNIGMVGANAQAFAQIMGFAESWGAGYVIAGDFNMPVASVRLALRKTGCPADAVAPGRPTCVQNRGSSEIDFFVLPAAMMPAVRKCVPLFGTHVYPHLPVQLSLCFLSKVGRTLAWVQRGAPPLATRPVCGPAPEPDPRWRYVAAELATAACALTATAAAVVAGDEASAAEWGNGDAMRSYHRAFGRWQDLANWELSRRMCDAQVGRQPCEIFRGLQLLRTKPLKGVPIDSLLQGRESRDSLGVVQARKWRWLGSLVRSLCSAIATIVKGGVWSDWQHLESCLAAIEGAEPPGARHGPCVLADHLVAAALRRLRVVGAEETARHSAVEEVYSMASIAAKFQLVGLAYANAATHDARQSWMTWANRALTLHGGSQACKFLKPRCLLVVPGRNDAENPSADECPVQAEAEAISRPFVKVWCADKGEPISVRDRCESALMVGSLPPMSADLIARSALAFRPGSAASEGWHPRHFSCISSEAREALVLGLRCAELAGDYPEQWRRLRLPVLEQTSGRVGLHGPEAKPRVIGISRRCGGSTCVCAGWPSAIGSGLLT